jgi:hypothetical protein
MRTFSRLIYIYGNSNPYNRFIANCLGRQYPLQGILLAIFVIGVPPSGTLVYILSTIIKAFIQSPKIVKM